MTTPTSKKEGRKEIVERIRLDILEASSPYDNATWKNTLSVEHILSLPSLQVDKPKQ